MTRIEPLLRKTIRLDPAAIGPTGVRRAIRLRMRSLGLKRLEDCEGLMQGSRAEWNELVESVVVTETWFFRDATNDTRAMDCYRQALYHEPDHCESLLQMALLLQKGGDDTHARAFSNRA